MIRAIVVGLRNIGQPAKTSICGHQLLLFDLVEFEG
jgi:hypothetical protein